MMTGELGARIKALRQNKEMTVRALSGRSGISVGYLSELENGHKCNPGLVRLNRLAEALGVAVEELLAARP